MHNRTNTNSDGDGKCTLTPIQTVIETANAHSLTSIQTVIETVNAHSHKYKTLIETVNAH